MLRPNFKALSAHSLAASICEEVEDGGRPGVEGGFWRAREVARLDISVTAWQESWGQRPRAWRKRGAER